MPGGRTINLRRLKSGVVGGKSGARWRVGVGCWEESEGEMEAGSGMLLSRPPDSIQQLRPDECCRSWGVLEIKKIWAQLIAPTTCECVLAH